MERAVLGGGCFWCVEGAFKGMRGISSALPGYAGGHDPNPNYNSVCSGSTGHAEVVEIIFDEDVISGEVLVHINPFLVEESGSSISAGQLCVEIASFINPDVTNVSQIGALAGLADRIDLENPDIVDQYDHGGDAGRCAGLRARRSQRYAPFAAGGAGTAA